MAKTMVKEKAHKAETPSAAASPKHKKLHISLGLKFGLPTALLISSIMLVVGYYIYLQQRHDLTLQVIERADTIARNLASNSSDAILTSNVLDLAVMVKESVETEPSQEALSFSNIANGKEWLMNAWVQITSTQVKERGKNDGIVSAMIVNKDGVILAHSEPDKAGSKYTPPVYLPREDTSPLLQALNLELVQSYPIYEDQKHHKLYDIQADIKLKGTDQPLGVVHLALDPQIIDRVVTNAVIKLVAIALAALVSGVLLILIVVTWLVRPVGKLVRGVLAIAGGDFNQELKVNTRDELGDLTRAFNDMAKTLREKQTLEGAFSRYVSSAVMEEVYQDPSKAATIHARRIQATVYSSDVRGFTAMSESMEPEEVVNVINEYLSTQAYLLTKAGAEVNKFVGDATVAVFGMREAKPDDPLRAVKTAVKIQQTLKKINEQREKSGLVVKQIGIGVNTGEMVLGNIGSMQKMENTVIGDNVVLADKLCDNCPGGSVMISHSTYELVKDEVEVKALEPLVLEGRKEPVKVYEVTGLK